MKIENSNNKSKTKLMQCWVLNKETPFLWKSYWNCVSNMQNFSAAPLSSPKSIVWGLIMLTNEVFFFCINRNWFDMLWWSICRLRSSGKSQSQLWSMKMACSMLQIAAHTLQTILKMWQVTGRASKGGVACASSSKHEGHLMKTSSIVGGMHHPFDYFCISFYRGSL